MADVNEWLDEMDAPDYVREAFSGSKLREKLEQAHARIAELEPLADEVTSLRQAPKRESVFKELLGEDTYTSLNERDTHILNQFTWEGDEPDREEVSAYLEKWKFTPGAAQPSGETPAAQGVVNAAVAPGAPIQTQDLDAQIATAEAEGNWTAARALKSQRAQEKRAATSL